MRRETATITKSLRRVRPFAWMLVGIGVSCVALVLFADLGLRLNDDLVDTEVTGPHPLAGSVGWPILIVGLFALPILAGLSFVLLIWAFWQPSLLVNVAAALFAFVSFCVASALSTNAMNRIRANPAHWHARAVTRLAGVMQHYAQTHNGCLPRLKSWCEELNSFDPNAGSPFRYPHVPYEPNGLSSLALNEKVEGIPLSGLSGDVVLLFSTRVARNPAGGRDLLTANNYDRKRAIVLFGDLHMEFVKEEEFDDLRWEPSP